MRSIFLCLVVSVFSAACNPQLLDLHVLAANDFRLASDQAVAPLRAMCPTRETSSACERVYAAQHAYVDAHIEFVTRLQQEAADNHWRRPNDAPERRALCQSYRAYADAADALDVQLVALPLYAAQLCASEVR